MPYKKKTPSVDDIIGSAEPASVSSVKEPVKDVADAQPLVEEKPQEPVRQAQGESVMPVPKPQAEQVQEPVREFGPRLDTQTYEVSGILDIMPEDTAFCALNLFPQDATFIFPSLR